MLTTQLESSKAPESAPSVIAGIYPESKSSNTGSGPQIPPRVASVVAQRGELQRTKVYDTGRGAHSGIIVKVIVISIVCLVVGMIWYLKSTMVDEPSVRKCVNDYSWSELSQISTMVSRAPSDDEAIKIAKRYRLCTDDGKLDGTQTKGVLVYARDDDGTITDTTSACVRVIGFNHDDKSDGTGKAGITFMFTAAVSTQPMNCDGTSEDGWKGSDLRSWLNGSFKESLPDDLVSAMLITKQATNDTGKATNADVISSTDKNDANRIFVPSVADVFSTSQILDLKLSDSANDILDAEGKQYKYFANRRDGLKDNLGFTYQEGNALLSAGASQDAQNAAAQKMAAEQLSIGAVLPCWLRPPQPG